MGLWLNLGGVSLNLNQQFRSSEKMNELNNLKHSNHKDANYLLKVLKYQRGLQQYSPKAKISTHNQQVKVSHINVVKIKCIEEQAQQDGPLVLEIKPAQEEILNKILLDNNNQYDSKNYSIKHKIQKFTRLISQFHLFSLKSVLEHGLRSLLLEILDNLQIYRIQLQELILVLKNVIQSLVFGNQPFYEKVFPQILDILAHINFKMDCEMVQKKNTLEYLYFNRLNKQNAQSIIQLFNKSSEKEQNYIIRLLKGRLSQISSKIQAFYYFQSHQQVGNSIQSQIEHLIRQISQHFNGQNVFFKTEIFSARADFQNIQLYPFDCIACCPYYHHLQFLPSSLQNQVNIYSFDSVNFIEQSLEQLLTLICALLNSGGGLILFGVKKEFARYVVHGEYLIDKSKKHVAELIMKSLNQSIYPFRQIDKQVTLNFVRIIKFSTFKQPSLEEIQSDVRLKSCNSQICVVRLRVCSLDSAATYFIRQGSGLQAYRMGSNSNLLKLSYKQTIKMVKQKASKQLLAGQKLRHLVKLTSESQKLFGHQCKSAYSFQYFINSAKKVESKNHNEKEQKFQEMCLLIMKQKNLGSLKRKLIDKGYQCSIVLEFIDYRFTSSKNTAVLYIDLPFERIVEQIALNCQFYVQNRAINVVRICRYIKLVDRESNKYSRQQFNTLEEWMVKQFPGYLFTLYQYECENSNQYYFQCQTKRASLFLYYLLTNFNEKCLFKQPKGLQLLTNQERQSKWISIYSTLS